MWTNKYTAFFTSLTLLSSSPALAVTQYPQAPIPQASAIARTQQRQAQLQLILPAAYDLTQYPLGDANEKHWRQLLWATAVIEPQDAYVSDGITQILAFTAQPTLRPSQARSIEMALQVGTQLYLSDPIAHENLKQALIQTLNQSQNPQWVAMSLSALAKSGASTQQQQQWINAIAQRFPNWSKDVALYTTIQDLTDSTKTPPLRDLLKWSIVPNQLQIYVICARDRAQLCSAFVKDRQGKFVRQNGRVWTMPLLTRSLHNLSWNFSRGYTPQGIYRVEETIPQPDTDFFRAYGYFSLVKLFAPFEPGVKAFLPGRKGTLNRIDAYNALLPPSWQGYFPIQGSYWAGMAGRSLFRIHGSGEPVTFFTNNQRYPESTGWNPAIGCLSAQELYDETGRLLSADMPKILNAISTIAGTKPTGYLIVVEVPNPIAAEQLINAL